MKLYCGIPDPLKESIKTVLELGDVREGKSKKKIFPAEPRKIWRLMRWCNPALIKILVMDDKETNVDVYGSELDMAELFAANCQEHLRYVESEDKWYSWTGELWEKGDAAAYRRVREFVKLQLAAGPRDSRYSRQFQTAAGLRSILKHASTVLGVQAVKGDFDNDPNLLAVKGGVVDLRTGTFREATPADMIARAVEVAFDANAECPRWMQFLDEVTAGDKDLAEFLRRAVGYTLYGHTRAQALFIVIGKGANGKGVFLRTIYALLGQYALLLPGSLMIRAYANASGPSPAVAKIINRRFLMCTEVPKRPLDEAFVKALSGSDPISARGLYQEQAEFLPVGKLWLSVNEMPTVRFNDDAIWRRIVPIPFDQKFHGEKRDELLEQTLAKELPGILNWALAGAVRYPAEGLELCSASRKLRERLHRKVDTVGEWIKGRCIVASEAKLSASHAYDSYADYMRRQKRPALSVPEFKAALIQKGYEHKRSQTNNLYRGLKLAKLT